MSSFSSAFKAARKELGAGKTFEWEGKRYSTNLKDEKPAKPTAPAKPPKPTPRPAAKPTAGSKTKPAGANTRSKRQAKPSPETSVKAMRSGQEQPRNKPTKPKPANTKAAKAKPTGGGRSAGAGGPVSKRERGVTTLLRRGVDRKAKARARAEANSVAADTMAALKITPRRKPRGRR